MGAPHRQARAEGQRQRVITLLEAIGDTLDADVDDKEQCPSCGRYFKQVHSHAPHCDGPV